MEQDEAKSGSPLTRVREFVKDVRVEATKISWPTRLELRDSTAVVRPSVAGVRACEEKGPFPRVAGKRGRSLEC